jgi:uncharacterized membrane protein YdfJ with MMPL/SSD domain
LQKPENITARIGRWSVQHRKKAIFGWLAFVVVSVVIGFNLVPQKEIERNAGGPGESGQAAKAVDGAFPDESSEQVLVQSKELQAGDAQFKAAVADVTQRLQETKGVGDVVGPYDGEVGQISADGHSALITFELPGDAKKSEESVVHSLAAVAAAQKAHPELRVEEAGDSSINKAVADKSDKEMGKSTLFSVPLTLLILVFAFGALAAAGIPLLLALTSVLATLGLLGPVSQIAPVDGSVMHVVLLVGMAVGVDYSLFYVKRAREERAAGRENDAAIEAAAATSGRAVLISGITVMVAMAGMYLGGISNFASFATGTIMVVAVAVIGSLTVLPALLSKLGDRVDKGRVPLVGRLKKRVGEAGLWSRFLDRVLRRPLVSALVSAGVLVALAVPALGMQTTLAEENPRDLQVVQTYDRIQDAFPSEGSMEMVVVKADDVTSPAVVSAIDSLESQAQQRQDLFEGQATLEVSSDQTVAIVSLPTTGTGTDELSNRAADALRGDLVPATVGQVEGVEAYTTGEAAATGDFNDAMIGNLPYVFAFVLGAAFLLLLVTFRSLVIPIKAIVLNLLSVGSAYGLLVLVFQNDWAEGLLGFEGNGAIAAWLPLFLFVILFGLSMDYHVFILTRVREAFDRGMKTEDAVAHGIKSTAGVVTSAAIVMVAVFSMFALSSELQMKQMGIGLAAAVLIDATIIRGVLLPATMKLLGDWNWWLPGKLGWLPDVSREAEVVPAKA